MPEAHARIFSPREPRLAGFAVNIVYAARIDGVGLR
jgi:hypothetical protein